MIEEDTLSRPWAQAHRNMSVHTCRHMCTDRHVHTLPTDKLMKGFVASKAGLFVHLEDGLGLTHRSGRESQLQE